MHVYIVVQTINDCSIAKIYCETEYLQIPLNFLSAEMTIIFATRNMISYVITQNEYDILVIIQVQDEAKDEC